MWVTPATSCARSWGRTPTPASATSSLSAAIRRGDRAFLVAIGGPATAWVKNIRARPRVTLRVGGGRFGGFAREPRDDSERQEAMRAYCDTVHGFDLAACAMHRRGLPSRAKVRELHLRWFGRGLPLVVDLEV